LINGHLASDQVPIGLGMLRNVASSPGLRRHSQRALRACGLV